MADKKQNPFDGYKWADWDDETRGPNSRPLSGAKGAEKAFSRDTEGMKSDYEKFKGPKDPDAEAMAASLGKGDIKAWNTMDKAHKKADSYKGALKNQVMYGMKKGGSVRSASQRADGCAIRGKTRA